MKKFKKTGALLLTGSLLLSLTACGNNSEEASTDGTSKDDDKLVVWTLSSDLMSFSEKFKEEKGVDVETVVIEQANYPTKVQTALLGGETEPDIIVAEPQMLEDFYDADFFEDLDQYGAQDYADQIVDYVWEAGQSSDGVQRAISYQITPVGIYYRRDIAKNVFGTDDPDEIGKLFADYSTILDTAEKLRNAGYRIFASDTEMEYFSGDSAWVIDGKLNLDQERFDYMDLCSKLYQEDYTAYAMKWSTPWYQSMGSPIPILSSDIQNGSDESVNVWGDAEEFSEQTKDSETTEIFAYALPTWGTILMKDNMGSTSGSWGICAGPSNNIGGGTFIGISSKSERKDTAWEYVKFCTLNEDVSNWWVEESGGDTVSLVPVLEQHMNDESEIYGNEKIYEFWYEQAQKIDYSKVTRYDGGIRDAWNIAISSVKTGEASQEEAVEQFYDTIESTYPEIEVER